MSDARNLDPVLRDRMLVVFHRDVFSRSAEVDESDDLDWRDLVYGWAIGKGLSFDDAWQFSLYVRYHWDEVPPVVEEAPVLRAKCAMCDWIAGANLHPLYAYDRMVGPGHTCR